MPRQNDEVPGGKYVVQRKLGKGSYGTVYLVRDKATGSQCCMKKMSLKAMGEQERVRALQEANLLGQLKHPNIVAYEDSFVHKSRLYLFMQFCEGGDLDERLRAMQRKGEAVKEELVLDWAAQMAFALQYLHKRKILHRDLKAANVFLTGSGVVKLGDFGVSRVLSQTQELASTFVGTPYYLSPELLSNKPYDAASDVWAYGCIVYEMCTFRHPFEASDFSSLAVEILNGDPEPLPPMYSHQLGTLIAAILRKNVAERICLRDVINAPIVRARVQSFLQQYQAPKAEPLAAQVLGDNSQHPCGRECSETTPGETSKAATARAGAACARDDGPEAAEGSAQSRPDGIDAEELRPHMSSRLPSSASYAMFEGADGAEVDREADLLAQIDLEKKRLQEKMAVLEQEQRRVAEQQRQASSLRAFQSKLEASEESQSAHTGGTQALVERAPAAHHTDEASHGHGGGRGVVNRIRAIPTVASSLQPTEQDVINEQAALKRWELPSAPSRLDTTQRGPTDPAIGAHHLAVERGGLRPRPSHLDMTTDDATTAAALEATVDPEVVGAFEPPTRTVEEWASCYVRTNDGTWQRRSSNLDSPNAEKQPSASGAAGADEEKYESDFEAYSSHVEEENDEHHHARHDEGNGAADGSEPSGSAQVRVLDSR